MTPERRDLANRDGFDGAAERYDRARHGYPDALFGDLFARLPPRAEVVEVGPGTGQATRSLLAHGARVTAVELGAALGARLRHNLPDHDLRVVVSPFESSVLPAGSFDGVVSATAFHWVPTGSQIIEPARLLRPGGWLGVIDTIQIRSAVDGGFWERIQEVFARHGAGRTSDDPVLTTFEDARPGLHPTLAGAQQFTDVEVLRYPFDQTYTSAQYADLHRTYSGWLAMEPAAGDALLADVVAVIDAEYGGAIVRPLAITLLLGRRRAP